MLGQTRAQISGQSSQIIIETSFPRLSPEDLFAYFTNAELLQRWWPPAATTEPWLGGGYHLSWPEMDWHLRGEYKEFIPGRRLAFTWRWDHKPELPERLVEIDIEPATKGSSLTVTHGHYTESRLDQDDRQSHADGWTYFLGQLQRV